MNDLPPIDWHSLGIDTKGKTSGHVKVTCPKCSHTRSNKREPCLSVDLDRNVWNCHHCGWTGPEKGYARERGIVGDDGRRPAKQYRRPEPAGPVPSDAVETFFAARGISPATYQAFGVYFDGKSLAFPYHNADGELINIKHRFKKDGKKRFYMEPDCELTFWGLDHIDADLETVVIVEGEPDLLALHEAGVRNILSVPNGAPPEKADLAAAPLEYLPSGQAIFNKARRIILAGDMDAPGTSLTNELARRIGKSKCWRVFWPTGCKDGNDTLMEFGPEGVRAAIDTAEPFPVEGITQPSDYLADLWKYESDISSGEPIADWPGFSKLVRFSEGQLTIITGIPSSGKSVFLNALMMHKAMQHDWKFGLFSPEYHPTDLHMRDLVELYLDKPMNHKFRNHASREEVQAAVAAINDRVRFILPPKPTLELVMERAQTLVYREGIKALVIDPWTELDQTTKGTMTTTDWVDTCLKEIRRFGREYGVHMFVVAHPTKVRPELQKDGTRKQPVVTPYDISDSRHWYEMADVILSVWRNNADPTDPVQIHVQKVRFSMNGETGTALFDYNRVTRRYTDVTPLTPAGSVLAGDWHE